MKILAGLSAILGFALWPAAADAQAIPSAKSADVGSQATQHAHPAASRHVARVSWVEEWDPVRKLWVRVSPIGQSADKRLAARLPRQDLASRRAYLPTPGTFTGRQMANGMDTPPLAHYGPFAVINNTRAALLGSTSSAAPRQFSQMMRDFPQLEVLEMIEAPGTSNDLANLKLGRMIRAAGLATHVPRGGSVRSGAVELFLAGVERIIDPGARFAVHAWLDNYGRQPDDFAPDAPENRLYLDFYVEMGMSESQARSFYAMTNSVPHSGALWLRAEQMRRWVGVAGRPMTRQAARLLANGKAAEKGRGSAPNVVLAGAKALRPFDEQAPATAFALPDIAPAFPAPLEPAFDKAYPLVRNLAPPRINYLDTIRLPSAKLATLALDSRTAFA